jgi:hypothetical protein
MLYDINRQGPSLEFNDLVINKTLEIIQSQRRCYEESAQNDPPVGFTHRDIVESPEQYKKAAEQKDG